MKSDSVSGESKDVGMHAADLVVMRIIFSAFEKVQAECRAESGAALKPAERSQRWLSALNDEFRTAIAGDGDIRSLCKACSDNKAEFGLNELLHDVCVVRVGTVVSHRGKKLLTYVRDVLWQVESEFSSSGTEAAIDFNKLILGSARNKLFIGPLTRETVASMRDVHARFAFACSGSVYVAFLPTPDVWPTGIKPQIYRFDRPSGEFSRLA